MSSTYKFPNGLNNWIDSDKPARLDFVTDNEILEESAMWKATYDAKANEADEMGPVEAAGGISAFAMAKTAYDEDGSVAQAGGIQAAIDLAVEMETSNVMLKTDYAYDAVAEIVDGELVVVSEYEHSGTDYDVQFTAPADYSAATPIVIDGTQMATVTAPNMEVLQKPWKQGALVRLTRQGNRAFITGAGGIPASGGVFTGPVQDTHQNRTGYYLRGITVQNSAGAEVATSRIIMRRQ